MIIQGVKVGDGGVWVGIDVGMTVGARCGCGWRKVLVKGASGGRCEMAQVQVRTAYTRCTRIEVRKLGLWEERGACGVVRKPCVHVK